MADYWKVYNDVIPAEKLIQTKKGNLYSRKLQWAVPTFFGKVQKKNEVLFKIIRNARIICEFTNS